MYYLRFLFRTEVIHLLSKSKENKLSHRCYHLVFIKKITGMTIVFHETVFSSIICLICERKKKFLAKSSLKLSLSKCCSRLCNCYDGVCVFSTNSRHSYVYQLCSSAHRRFTCIYEATESEVSCR